MHLYLTDHIFRTRIFKFGSNETYPKRHNFLLEFIAKTLKSSHWVIVFYKGIYGKNQVSDTGP